MNIAKMNRRQIMGSMLASAAGALAPTRLLGQTASRANLILFFPDEMRADALGCYGNPVTRTPNFDRLATDGARFANCHVQFPVCTQSRASLLTGWPTSVRGHRSLYYNLRSYEPNLFRYLKQGGYDVFWYGKNDALAPDVFAESATDWRFAQSSGPMNGPSPGRPNDFVYPGGEDRRASGDYRALQWAFRVLERKEADKPFCLFLPLGEPHPPYGAPAGFDTLYKPDDMPALVPPNLPGKPDFHRAIREAYGLTGMTERDFRQVRANYYGMVSYSDWLLGELLEKLEATGRARDTAIFCASDHGDYAGDYGLVEKWPSGLESCLTHVPLIGRIPGVKAGTVQNGMVELYDIMASMLELGGVKPTHTHFARSLVDQMRGETGDPTRAAFCEGGYNVNEPQAFEDIFSGVYGPKTRLEREHPETVRRVVSVRTRRYTYIERPTGQSEFYDRQRDPMETRNLIDSSAHVALIRVHQRQLLDWYVTTAGVPEPDRDGRGMPPSPIGSLSA